MKNQIIVIYFYQQNILISTKTNGCLKDTGLPLKLPFISINYILYFKFTLNHYSI